MNDPWNVKSVRQPDQYQSQMKINGVPLLPPVLSNECRKEMQYYKLLAKEVEKRILHLKPYVENDLDTNEIVELINTPHLDIHQEHAQDSLIVLNLSPANDNKTAKSVKKSKRYEEKNSPVHITLDSNLEHYNIEEAWDTADTGSASMSSQRNSPVHNDLPERDHDDFANKEMLLVQDIMAFDALRSSSNDVYMSVNRDGPSSISSKSLTGSLHDIYTESASEVDQPSLTRQHSYTLLKPSPALIEHLKIQSICTGVDLSSISMSESVTNIYSHCKKRRSWDLETAKLKWSSMAMDLRRANVREKRPPKNKENDTKIKPTSVVEDKVKKPVISITPKSEPVQRSKTPVRTKPTEKSKVADKTIESPSQNNKLTSPVLKQEDNPTKDTAVTPADEATLKVKELYEKLQKQQQTQMITLMEKQKREQLILQKVFEEQNDLLLKQLKTVCPKASIEVKEAWGDLKDGEERGPVSLSQLIDDKTSEHNSPASKMLTDTNVYIERCDKVLKTSRDITNNMTKQPQTNRTQNIRYQKSGDAAQTINQLREDTDQNNSLKTKNSSRKLVYSTTSSERELSNEKCDYEPILTDRTNDTLADLNETFTTDNSDQYCVSKKASPKFKSKTSYRDSSPSNKSQANGDRRVRSGSAKRRATSRPNSPKAEVDTKNPTTDLAIKNTQDTIQNSIKTVHAKTGFHNTAPTSDERAAASTIVAYAKGYLVRRLLRTERVQGIVQTIRDALLCALQLHQDRDIRGADVDLHRRLIQQITAACYTLHDTFVTSTPEERCAMIAADRARKQAVTSKRTPKTYKRTDIMSQSHSGAFPARTHRAPSNVMTQSNYETFSGSKGPRFTSSPQRAPWRC